MKGMPRLYCLDCGERWSLDPDKHQMRCVARAALLEHRAEPTRPGKLELACSYRGQIEQAPEPKPVGARASRRRQWLCHDCRRKWSAYAGLHERGCSAAWLLARGRRDEATKRFRVLLVASVRLGGAA